MGALLVVRLQRDVLAARRFQGAALGQKLRFAVRLVRDGDPRSVGPFGGLELGDLRSQGLDDAAVARCVGPALLATPDAAPTAPPPFALLADDIPTKAVVHRQFALESCKIPCTIDGVLRKGLWVLKQLDQK